MKPKAPKIIAKAAHIHHINFLFILFVVVRQSLIENFFQ